MEVIKVEEELPKTEYSVMLQQLMTETPVQKSTIQRTVSSTKNIH